MALLRYEPGQLSGTGLPDAVVSFLVEHGLPDDVPGLDFEVPKGEHVSTLPEHWGVSEETKARLRRYVHIGSDQGGNPLCLDPADGGTVVLLDHEEDFLPEFVNSSIRQLVECLMAYRQLYDKVTGDEDAPFGLEDQRWLEAEIRRIDSPALREISWWSGVVHYLMDFR